MLCCSRCWIFLLSFLLGYALLIQWKIHLGRRSCSFLLSVHVCSLHLLHGANLKTNSDSVALLAICFCFVGGLLLWPANTMHSFEEERETVFTRREEESSGACRRSDAERETLREAGSGVGVSQLTTMLEMQRTFADDAEQQKREDRDSEGSLSAGSMRLSPRRTPMAHVGELRGSLQTER